MKITNTKASLRVVSVPGVPGGRATLLRLVPGVNEVDEAVFAQVKDRPQVKAWIESGAIVLGVAKVAHSVVPAHATPVDEGAGDEGAGGESLADYTTEEAAELIEAETDVALLEAWKAAEKRKGVSSLLDARIAKLKV